MPVLIDGHNLLHAICGDDERFAPVDAPEMCRKLEQFLGATGDAGELVFDGRGPHDRRVYLSLRHLRVVFAGDALEADHVIENKVQEASNPKAMLVVSSDRQVQRAALKARAQCMRVDDFWEMVVTRLQRKPRRREPPAKRAGLSDRETDHWMETFGFEE